MMRSFLALPSILVIKEYRNKKRIHTKGENKKATSLER
jgi:hypothetical protein